MALLRRAPVFSALTERDLEEVARTAVFRQYSRGEIILHRGQVWNYGMLVQEGTIRVVKGSADGRILAALILLPGDLFLSHSLFDGGPAPASLEAESSVSCCLWDESTIKGLVMSNPAALWEVSRVLAGMMRRASDVIDTLAFQPLSRRLARLLLEAYDQEGSPNVPRTLTLDDMAARLNTTREVVCRLLYKLADDGMLNITRTEFIFVDRERLARLADDRPAGEE